jgi:hypothetical protein
MDCEIYWSIRTKNTSRLSKSSFTVQRPDETNFNKPDLLEGTLLDAGVRGLAYLKCATGSQAYSSCNASLAFMHVVV